MILSKIGKWNAVKFSELECMGWGLKVYKVGVALIENVVIFWIILWYLSHLSDYVHSMHIYLEATNKLENHPRPIHKNSQNCLSKSRLWVAMVTEIFSSTSSLDHVISYICMFKPSTPTLYMSEILEKVLSARLLKPQRYAAYHIFTVNMLIKCF